MVCPYPIRPPCCVRTCYNPRVRIPSPASWLVLAALATVAPSAVAQPAPPPPDEWPSVLTRAALSATGEFLNSRQPDMPLSVMFRGDVDLVDFGAMRIPFDFTFAVAFNDHFNPRHADYSFRFTPTVPVGRVDLSALYHHTSRHLHDAERPAPISWDSFGGRAATGGGSGRWLWSSRFEASYYPDSRRRYVDYQWEAVEAGRVSYRVSPRWAYYGDATLREVRCDRGVAGRDRAWGSRIEAGLVLGYRGGIAEVFIGWDRRIDPDPLEHSEASFFVFGGRLVVSR